MADPDPSKLEQAVEELLKHFDTVQIFATSVDSQGDTYSYASGDGNYYARRGQVDEWLRIQQANLPSPEEDPQADAGVYR